MHLKTFGSKLSLPSLHLTTGAWAPKFYNPNKKHVFDLYRTFIANLREDEVVDVHQVKWESSVKTSALDSLKIAKHDHGTHVVVKPDVFNYVNFDGSGWNENFWLNFGDQNLFFAYAGSLLAQDEVQTLEFPELAGALEYMNGTASCAIEPYTLLYGQPRPILFSGVHRMGALTLGPSAICPQGLYGNNFEYATPHEVEQSLKVFPWPSDQKYNILSMSALGYLSGTYTKDQIQVYIYTATLAFSMCRWHCNENAGQEGKRVIIHTGNWGCGAFGNNLELMSMVQYAAALLAGVSDIVFHTFDSHSEKVTNHAIQRFRALIEEHGEMTMDQVVDVLVSQNLTWGESNGT